MSTRDTAEKYFAAEHDAFLKGDFNALSKVEDPNVVWHMGPPMGDIAGHEAHKQYILSGRKAAADMKVEFKYLAGDGNLFACSFTSSGRFVAEMPGMPLPIGKSFVNDYLMVMRLHSGKVAEVWTHGTMTLT
jgi:ketosteroid isomerase-like protein